MPSKKFLIYAFFLFLSFSVSNLFGQCSDTEIINLKKIAIIFGEADYKYHGLLANPVNDARAMCDSLTKIGFKVFKYENEPQQTMNDAIDSWCEKIANYDVALFYFSGHGADVDGVNYLFPTDINPKGSSDLLSNAVSANKILNRISNTNSIKYSIMILDACRNNPFTKSWAGGGSEGLTNMGGKQSFVAFATQPSKTALDGDSNNSPFTEGILKYITKPNLTISDIFTKVNGYVNVITKGEQSPFENSSLSTSYCFSVSTTYASVSPSLLSTFLQPTSGILIPENESEMFTIDTLGLSVMDKFTLGVKNRLIRNEDKATLITSRNENLYLASPSSQQIMILNSKTGVEASKINLAYSPINLIPSIDNRKLYVCGNRNKSGLLDIFDLQTKKLLKTISVGRSVANMVLSSDGKTLYLASNPSDSTLAIFDTKSDKIIRDIRGVVVSKAIGITPDNKKLYLGSADNKEIMIYDLFSVKKLKSISGIASSFAFTKDGQYAFALSPNKITLLRNLDGEPVSELGFTTPVKGLAVTSDGHAFVWLPEEGRVKMFFVNEQAKTFNIEIDPEEKLKNFRQQQVNNDPTLKDRERKNEICRKLNMMMGNVMMPIRGLAEELTINYSFRFGPQFSDCDKFIYSWAFGIGSTKDLTKLIIPVCQFQYNGSVVVFSMQDEKIDKVAESFSFPIDKLDDGVLRQFIRQYFAKRIENLK